MTGESFEIVGQAGRRRSSTAKIVPAPEWTPPSGGPVARPGAQITVPSMDQYRAEVRRT